MFCFALNRASHEGNIPTYIYLNEVSVKNSQNFIIHPNFYLYIYPLTMFYVMYYVNDALGVPVQGMLSYKVLHKLVLKPSV